MKHQLIIARTDSGCLAVILNQIVVAEAVTTTEREEHRVIHTGRQLGHALGVDPAVCNIKVPDELDGKWEWPDLIRLLPPVQTEMEKQNLIVYCWSEGGVHPDTQDGPGDAWDEMCVDFDPPRAGTPYLILAPVHEVSGDTIDAAVREKVLHDFKHWLNERRAHDVSAVFHETVEKVASLINLSRVQADDETLVEKVSMGVLGKEVDPVPGINWHCDRGWKVNDVRNYVRAALESAGIIRPEALQAPSQHEVPEF